MRSGERVWLSKARNLGKVSAKGGFNLFWGLAASSIISALGVIVVARILAADEYALISIALIGPSLIKTFRDLGIDQATIKYTAQYRSENKLANVKQILVAETLFEVIFGFLLSIVSFLLSGFMANMLGRPYIAPLIQIASLLIFAEALLKAAQSAFTGYEKMGLYSITLVIQSTFKTGLMIFLVVIGYGAYGATIGDATAYLIAGSISIVMLYLAIYKKLEKQKESLQIFATLKYMFKYGIPVSIAWNINGFLTQFYHV
ncbi:oligosaccharide flippase family protein, partial [Candidatus Bathyarchaeota archaeon]|nr:oligosaccharide flippase family protein [Candidatus Bathyarchaeota archaeon]